MLIGVQINIIQFQKMIQFLTDTFLLLNWGLIIILLNYL